MKSISNSNNSGILNFPSIQIGQSQNTGTWLNQYYCDGCKSYVYGSHLCPGPNYNQWVITYPQAPCACIHCKHCKLDKLEKEHAELSKKIEDLKKEINKG